MTNADQNGQSGDFAVHSSAVTDRGLNERRPLNEDSFLADSQRGVFAVADGVGGAEAGEVASQTAVEVLDEAFRHQVDGADIEDLMELAIQRANASIHQMAQEHAKFSMMATTIVALYIDGKTATFGHVGDSRLYRLTPNGELLRETEDHSVVEEEVRAGRMTPEQAANHPSKNVISRALGAEDDVEVDMKTIDIESGTQFLLCTDGITRHVPDYEIRQLLIVNDDLSEVCEELKRRCFERGAEDNLTAVLVRIGDAVPLEQRREELERTVSPEAQGDFERTWDGDQKEHSTKISSDFLVPASRVAFPSPDPPVIQHSNEAEKQKPLNISAPRSGSGRTLMKLFLFVVAIGAIAAAFYAGRVYKGTIPFLPESRGGEAAAATSPIPVEPAFMKFEQARRDVDADPAGWIANKLPGEQTRQVINNPLESNDPEFLYLYGRASLLTGNNEAAARAFEASINKANASPTAENSVVRRDATIALAALVLKLEKERPQASNRFDELLPKPSGSPSP